MTQIVVLSSLVVVGFCLAGCQQGATGTSPATVGVTPEVDGNATKPLQTAATKPATQPATQPATKLPTQPTDPPPIEPKLEVAISGAITAVGHYSCALFGTREDFEQRQNPRASTRVAADQDFVWKIDELPAGAYTIAVFHDANDNEKLDRNGFGFPTERYGFSNNARGKLGPPAYDQVAFEVGETPVQMRIQIK